MTGAILDDSDRHDWERGRFDVTMAGEAAMVFDGSRSDAALEETRSVELIEAMVEACIFEIERGHR